MQCLIPLVLFFVSHNAFSQRSVSIVLNEGKLDLTNGSSVQVHYSLECYDNVAGSVVSPPSDQNLSLNPKQSATFFSGGTCATNAPPAYKIPGSSGVVACAGANVSFASSSGLCGPNSQRCTYDSLVAKGITSFDNFFTSMRYWFEFTAPSFNGTTDNWGKSTTYSSSTTQGVTYFDAGKSTQNSKCGVSASGGIAHCQAMPLSAPWSIGGVLCCSIGGGFNSCKVTIKSSTPTGGFLQSPQFKGGSAF